MSRHGRSSRRMLVALMVVGTWLSSLLCDPRTVRGQMIESGLETVGTPSPNVAQSTDLAKFAESTKNVSASLVPAVAETEQYRHEHERVRMPSTYAERERVREQEQERERERERAELSSRSAFRPRIDDLAPAEFRPLVLKVAAHYDLDPRLLAAMIKYESNWNANAIGAAHDSGLMQIIPSTAEWIARKLGLKDYDVLDPETNLMMGAWYLKTLLKQHGDLEAALIEYNGGAAALRHPRGWDPYKYASRVISIRETGRYVY